MAASYIPKESSDKSTKEKPNIDDYIKNILELTKDFFPDPGEITSQLSGDKADKKDHTFLPATDEDQKKLILNALCNPRVLDFFQEFEHFHQIKSQVDAQNKPKKVDINPSTFTEEEARKSSTILISILDIIETLKSLLKKFSRLKDKKIDALISRTITLLSDKTDLSLCGAELNDSNIFTLCYLLNYNKTIRSLNLKDNKISPVGFKQLAKTIGQTNLITDLDVSYNAIGNSLYCICYLKNVLKLNLKHNSIGDAGISELEDGLKTPGICNIQQINLAWNLFTDAGFDILKKISTDKPSIYIINIAVNPNVSDDNKFLFKFLSRPLLNIVLNDDEEIQSAKPLVLKL